MTFLELAEEVLKKNNEALSAGEIWEKAVELNLTDKLNTKGKTPWATLEARLYTYIVENKENSIITTEEIRPKKFKLKNTQIPKKIEENVDIKQSNNNKKG